MHLVIVVLISGFLAVVGGSAAGGGIVAALGLVWVLLSRRSGIEVTGEGFKVNGLLRTRNLGWSQTDAFIVVSYAGTALPDYAYGVPVFRQTRSRARRLPPVSTCSTSSPSSPTTASASQVPGYRRSFLDKAFLPRRRGRPEPHPEATQPSCNRKLAGRVPGIPCRLDQSSCVTSLLRPHCRRAWRALCPGGTLGTHESFATQWPR